MIDPGVAAVAVLAAVIVALTKGAFGGGMALLLTPLLSLVMPPVPAAALASLLLCVMDVFTVWAFPPRTWSWVNLKLLALPLLLGIAIGALTFTLVDERWISILIAAITLAFTLRWLLSRRSQEAPPVPASAGRAGLWGTVAGFTTFVAHSGGPPLSIYLLPQRLPKTVLAGTTGAIFVLGNWIKLWPYLYLSGLEPGIWAAFAVAAPAVPLGVWLGRRLHDRLSEPMVYRACYGLTFLAALRLLWSGLERL